MFDMFVVDLLHEIELGVWKSLFIHLLRILDCEDEGLKHILDRRYAESCRQRPGGSIFCQVPTGTFVR